MEFQAQHHDSPVPPYEQWPSVPQGPLENQTGDDKLPAPILDNVISKDCKGVRATSVPSMDDIEAAQALEGLRSGHTISCCIELVFILIVVM